MSVNRVRPLVDLTRLVVGMEREMIDAVDRWRGQQPGVPPRSEAIRRLIDIGLSAQAASNAAA